MKGLGAKMDESILVAFCEIAFQLKCLDVILSRMWQLLCGEGGNSSIIGMMAASVKKMVAVV